MCHGKTFQKYFYLPPKLKNIMRNLFSLAGVSFKKLYFNWFHLSNDQIFILLKSKHVSGVILNDYRSTYVVIILHVCHCIISLLGYACVIPLCNGYSIMFHMALNQIVPAFSTWNDFPDDSANASLYRRGNWAKRSEIICSLTLSINAAAKMRPLA